jgi:CRP-like cAMP-binding protein
VTALEALRGVRWLSSLDDRAREAVAAQAERVTFAPGREIMAELEVGDELFIIVEGSARVTVRAASGERRELGTLTAGEACGEISLLSGELHSASVEAVTPVTALKLNRSEVEQLVSRHPPVLVHFARALARRIVDTDATLDALFDDTTGRAHPEEELRGHSAAVAQSKASIRRAWRELVVSHGRELPFFALAAFMATLLVVRGIAFALERMQVPLFDFLRGAYTLGIALVFLSTATSLVRFRTGVQRAIAFVYGVGFALILNELSVFLTFDTFYLNMTTRDPNLLFSVEALYRRQESRWAILLMVAFLAQLTFLRPFYRRVVFVLMSRLRRSIVSARP